MVGEKNFMDIILLQCSKNVKKQQAIEEQFSYLPEWLEELHKLNEAHCAVRNHEILEAFETAFASTVPRPAAPCPTTNKEREIYLNLKWEKKRGRFHTFSVHIQYPGCDLAVPERIGEDCGRDWFDPAMLEEEEEEEEEASNPEFLLDDRENGPGKLSSMETKTTLLCYNT